MTEDLITFKSDLSAIKNRLSILHIPREGVPGLEHKEYWELIISCAQIAHLATDIRLEFEHARNLTDNG